MRRTVNESALRGLKRIIHTPKHIILSDSAAKSGGGNDESGLITARAASMIIEEIAVL
jgi:hypothetical protein